MNFDLSAAWRTIHGMGSSFVAALPRLLLALLIVGLFTLVGKAVRAVVRRNAQRRGDHGALELAIGRLAQAAILLVGVLVAVTAAFPSFTPADLVSTLGIGGVAIGHYQGRLDREARRRDVGLPDIEDRRGVGHRLDPAHIDLLELLHVVQDVAQLLRELRLLRAGQGEAGEVHHVVEVEVGLGAHAGRGAASKQAVETPVGNRQKAPDGPMTELEPAGQLPYPSPVLLFKKILNFKTEGGLGDKRGATRYPVGAKYPLKAKVTLVGRDGEGNILQTLSRTLFEEVAFDRARVTSTDWASYPILGFEDAPAIVVDLVDRPRDPPLGAGEASATPVPAALANAVFDAVDARLTTVPFTRERVRAALS